MSAYDYIMEQVPKIKKPKILKPKVAPSKPAGFIKKTIRKVGDVASGKKQVAKTAVGGVVKFITKGKVSDTLSGAAKSGSEAFKKGVATSQAKRAELAKKKEAPISKFVRR